MRALSFFLPFILALTVWTQPVCNLTDYQVQVNFEITRSRHEDSYSLTPFGIVFGVMVSFEQSRQDAVYNINFKDQKHPNSTRCLRLRQAETQENLSNIFFLSFDGVKSTYDDFLFWKSSTIAALDNILTEESRLYSMEAQRYPKKPLLPIPVLLQLEKNPARNITENGECERQHAMNSLLETIGRQKKHFIIVSKSLDLWDQFLNGPEVEEYYHKFSYSEDYGLASLSRGILLGQEIYKLACRLRDTMTTTPTTYTATGS